MTTPPLLLLAAGRRPRPRKSLIVRPKGIAIHKAVAKLLRDHARPEWHWTHVPNGELRDTRTAAKLKQMGVRRGWPDFVLVSPTGLLHCLELKRFGETLSEDQQAFQSWCIIHGLPHSVARSFDDALAVLDHWGALRIKITACVDRQPNKTTKEHNYDLKRHSNLIASYRDRNCRTFDSDTGRASGGAGCRDDRRSRHRARRCSSSACIREAEE